MKLNQKSSFILNTAILDLARISLKDACVKRKAKRLYPTGLSQEKVPNRISDLRGQASQ